MSVCDKLTVDHLFLSKKITLSNSIECVKLGVMFLSRLISSKPNWPDGVNVVVEKPGSYRPQLKITGPGVLRVKNCELEL